MNNEKLSPQNYNQPEATGLNQENPRAFTSGQEVQVMRTNGEIEGGWKVSDYVHDENEEQPRVEVAKQDPDDPEGLMVKRIFEQKLIDTQNMVLQASAVERVAQEAQVDAESIQSPVLEVASEVKSEKEQALAELSQEDMNALLDYKSYERGKREAQKIGDGEGSIRQGQLAGQAFQAMSPKARELASWFVAS